jgi:hypothetical protein
VKPNRVSAISDLTQRIDDIPDALPGDDRLAEQYARRTGNEDCLTYLFGGDAA